MRVTINRLGQRNLGPDDRVISHCGKKARYPYLDENFLSWALVYPVWDKCGFGHNGAGTGADGGVNQDWMRAGRHSGCVRGRGIRGLTGEKESDPDYSTGGGGAG